MTEQTQRRRWTLISESSPARRFQAALRPCPNATWRGESTGVGGGAAEQLEHGRWRARWRDGAGWRHGGRLQPRRAQPSSATAREVLVEQCEANRGRWWSPLSSIVCMAWRWLEHGCGARRSGTGKRALHKLRAALASRVWGGSETSQRGKRERAQRGMAAGSSELGGSLAMATAAEMAQGPLPEDGMAR